MPFCPACGNEVLDTTEICPKCGTRVKGTSRSKHSKASGPLPKTKAGDTVTEEKNTLLAVIIGLVIPGAGVMYAGRMKEGMILLIATIILCFIVIGVIVWFYGVYRAFVLCEENNKLWKEYLEED